MNSSGEPVGAPLSIATPAIAPSTLSSKSIPQAISNSDAHNTTLTVAFNVQLSEGVLETFTVRIHPEWAPLGAARFQQLIHEVLPSHSC